MEIGAQRRRMSLRRYVVLIFHCTPLGPHQDRDRTVAAITDAGMWWQGMYDDVFGNDYDEQRADECGYV